MHGIALEVAYDGKDFCGWQHQPQGRSVQDVLTLAVEAMAGHSIKLRGAGRTDAGVHAIGQVAAFDCERDIAPEGWVAGLNTHLPDDLAVQKAWTCEVGFNPRFAATSKRYRYLIHLGAQVNTWWAPRAWHVLRSYHLRRVDQLDFEAARIAAGLLEGRHPFGAFRGAGDTREDTLRTLTNANIRTHYFDEPELVAFEFEGDGFMKHMVRIMVGSLIDVARGTLSIDTFTTLLTADAVREDNPGRTAPPHGLTLMKVHF